MQAENDRFAQMILAVNLGSHGKPSDLRREIDKLTGTRRQKSMSVEDALKLGQKVKLPG